MTGTLRVFPKKTETRKYRTGKINRKTKKTIHVTRKRQEITDELRLI